MRTMLSAGATASAAHARCAPRRAIRRGPCSGRASVVSSLHDQMGHRRAAAAVPSARRGQRLIVCLAAKEAEAPPAASGVPDKPPSGTWRYKYLYDGACSVCRGLARPLTRPAVPQSLARSWPQPNKTNTRVLLRCLAPDCAPRVPATIRRRRLLGLRP